MAWKNIKEALYAEMQGITAGGQISEDHVANYTWGTGRDASLTYPDSKATFILEYPLNRPFEDNKKGAKGITSFERKNSRIVHFIGRVISDLGVVTADEILDKNNDALDKALEDIKSVFCGAIPNTLCREGVTLIGYSNATKRPLESKGPYYPYEVLVAYEIEYVEKIC